MVANILQFDNQSQILTILFAYPSHELPTFQVKFELFSFLLGNGNRSFLTLLCAYSNCTQTFELFHWELLSWSPWSPFEAPWWSKTVVPTKGGASCITPRTRGFKSRDLAGHAVGKQCEIILLEKNDLRTALHHCLCVVEPFLASTTHPWEKIHGWNISNSTLQNARKRKTLQNFTIFWDPPEAVYEEQILVWCYWDKIGEYPPQFHTL